MDNAFSFYIIGIIVSITYDSSFILTRVRPSIIIRLALIIFHRIRFIDSAWMHELFSNNQVITDDHQHQAYVHLFDTHFLFIALMQGVVTLPALQLSFVSFAGVMFIMTNGFIKLVFIAKLEIRQFPHDIY